MSRAVAAFILLLSLSARFTQAGSPKTHSWTPAGTIARGEATPKTADPTGSDEERSEPSSGRSPAPVDRSPVAIHKPLPVPPVETFGTGLAPVAAVRLTVDASGRVEKVQIESLKPSSSYDAFYEREITSTLVQWRFAPAIKNGKPDRADLEWKIQFEPRESQAGHPMPATILMPSSGYRGSSLDEENAIWTRFVSTLDEEGRRKVMDDLRKAADKHLSGNTITEARTNSFLVVTDSPRDGVAQAVGQNLEATLGAVHSLFKSKIPPAPSPDRILAYVYSSKSSFQALNQEFGAPDRADGVYRTPGLLVVSLEFDTSTEFMTVLLHEAVHAYLDRYIVRPGIVIPVWIHEGLAEYMANSDIKDGRIVPGAHRQRQVMYRNPVVSFRGPSASYLGAAEVKKALRSGRAISLQDLIAAGGNDFYGERYRLFYTQSWMFVHFLINGKPSWAAEEFPRFLLYVAEGFPAPASFRSIYGCDPAALEQEFKKYAEKF